MKASDEQKPHKSSKHTCPLVTVSTNLSKWHSQALSLGLCVIALSLRDVFLFQSLYPSLSIPLSQTLSLSSLALSLSLSLFFFSLFLSLSFCFRRMWGACCGRSCRCEGVEGRSCEHMVVFQVLNVRNRPTKRPCSTITWPSHEYAHVDM